MHQLQLKRYWNFCWYNPATVVTNMMNFLTSELEFKYATINSRISRKTFGLRFFQTNSSLSGPRFTVVAGERSREKNERCLILLSLSLFFFFSLFPNYREPKSSYFYLSLVLFLHSSPATESLSLVALFFSTDSLEQAERISEWAQVVHKIRWLDTLKKVAKTLLQTWRRKINFILLHSLREH